MSRGDLTTEKLTGGSLLVRNALFNLIGQGAPLLVAFFAIPLLIQGLGVDRFGILTLAWMIIGYFSLFDLGLGRALTQLVSEKLGTGQEQHVPALVWTALTLMFILGLLGAIVASVFSPWVVHSVLQIPAPLQAETLGAFYLLAVSIPIVISTAGVAGILAALQRFGILNMIRIPLGIFNFAAPLMVLPYTNSLLVVTAVLLTGRLIAWAVHLWVCLRTMPSLRSGFVLDRAAVKPLFHFGTWMTVTNVIGPLMVYLDRFVIGAIVSVAAVAYYATPYEMVTKLWIVPGAIVGVLFPAFAASYAQDRARTALLLGQGTGYVFIMLFPAVLLITSFAQEGLQWWLGSEFARHGAPVLQWLAVGVLINSLAQVAFALIQGAGRPDLTAKLHLVELPIYLLTFWWMLHAHGIVGAAIAWTVRVALDALFLFLLSARFLGETAATWWRVGRVMGFFFVLLAVAAYPETVVVRTAIVTVILFAFLPGAWFLILAPHDRSQIKMRLRSILS